MKRAVFEDTLQTLPAPRASTFWDIVFRNLKKMFPKTIPADILEYDLRQFKFAKLTSITYLEFMK